MSLPANVKKYLDASGVKYEELTHRTVYTAYDAAQTLKRELRDIAKNLLVQADRTFALVVVPADKRIDLVKLKKALGAKKVTISNEKIMVKVLKIKPGAVSSFGKLHRLELLVDKALLKSKKIVLSTGSYTDSVLMGVKDYIKLEEARVATIAMAGGYVVPKRVKKQMKKAVRTVAKRSGTAKAGSRSRAAKAPARKKPTATKAARKPAAKRPSSARRKR